VTATALLALDWGTTSARAYRLDGQGRVLDVRAAPLGVQHVQEGAFAAALARLLGDWAQLTAPRIACGMIGSRQGWLEAPYCATPASLAALAGALARVADAHLHIVPGMVTRDAQGVPDVMRGEETQALGAIAPDAAEATVVLPGTHSKWAQVSGEAITGFTTYLTGEAYAALLEHTILGRLATAPAGAAMDRAAFGQGVARGLAGGALLHDVFGARTLALFGELAPAAVADWLSGLLIGAEIHAARALAPRMQQVHVVAAQALTGRYVAACTQAGLRAMPAPPDAAARGLWRIAQQAGLV